MKVAAATAVSVLSACLLCAELAGAQLRPIEAAGDPRAALEKNWGPLPIPPGATYEPKCSMERRTAVFFLGLKVDATAYSRAQSEYMTQQAAFNADRAAGRRVTVERILGLAEIAFGTPESRALVQKVVTFLQTRGMIEVERGPMVILQFSATSEKAIRFGNVAASVNGAGPGPVVDRSQHS